MHHRIKTKAAELSQHMLLRMHHKRQHASLTLTQNDSTMHALPDDGICVRYCVV